MGVARGGLNNRPIWPAERAHFVVLPTPRETRRRTPARVQALHYEAPGPQRKRAAVSAFTAPISGVRTKAEFQPRRTRQYALSRRARTRGQKDIRRRAGTAGRAGGSSRRLRRPRPVADGLLGPAPVPIPIPVRTSASRCRNLVLARTRTNTPDILNRTIRNIIRVYFDAVSLCN